MRSSAKTQMACCSMLLGVGLCVIAGCGATPDEYGQIVGPQTPLSIAEVKADLASYLDTSCLIKAQIESVCPTAGCWCIITDGEEPLYVSQTTFALPRQAAGRRCLVAGKLVIRDDRPVLQATGIRLLRE